MGWKGGGYYVLCVDWTGLPVIVLFFTIPLITWIFPARSICIYYHRQSQLRCETLLNHVPFPLTCIHAHVSASANFAAIPLFVEQEAAAMETALLRSPSKF